MKKTGIMNSNLAAIVARMGHTDLIAVADAGLPIPKETERIDLAVRQGLPTFLDVLDNLLTEMYVEEIIIAEETEEYNAGLYKELQKRFENKKITFVSHEKLKKMTKECCAVVRTGECSGYSNIILKSGVIF